VTKHLGPIVHASVAVAATTLAMAAAWSTPAGQLLAHGASATELRVAPRPPVTTYVAVIDSDGKPVTGLTTDDFKVWLGSDECRVTDVGKPTEPIALVIAPAAYRRDVLPLRAAVAAVGEILSHEPGGFEVGLSWQTVRGVAFRRPGETDGLVADFNKGLSDNPALDDGVIGAAKALETRSTKRRVILALARYLGNSGAARDVMNALQRAKAVLWAVEVEPDHLHGADPGAPLATGPSGSDLIMTTAAPWSGGRTETILDINLIEEATRRQMDLLTNEYAVSFETPDRVAPGGSVRIAVRRNGVKILAPPWLG
jgi:hypothetical protein